MSTGVVVCPVYNQEIAVLNRIQPLEAVLDGETILIIDDGSSDSLESEIETSEHVHYLKHEKPLGYGGTVMSAVEYAAAHDNDIIYLIDMANTGFREAFSLLKRGISDGADIVNCSRFEQDDLTEDYASIHAGRVVTHHLRQASGLLFTDFFSPFKAARTNSLSSMTLEEFDEAILIQLWIQAAHFRLKCTELYCSECSQPGVSPEALEKESEYYLNFIRGETLLYPV
ncbi:MAG: glycosyltransferase [Spirochaetota bacterium]